MEIYLSPAELGETGATLHCKVVVYQSRQVPAQIWVEAFISSIDSKCCCELPMAFLLEGMFMLQDTQE
jgi:hypothetical protein